jgi:putative membrane protein
MKLLMMIAALAVAAFPALADGDVSGAYGYGHMFGGGMGVLGVGMMVLFWGGFILLMVLAVRWISGQNGASGNNDAFAILRDRLARGEIDPEEYETRRRALEA